MLSFPDSNLLQILVTLVQNSVKKQIIVDDVLDIWERNVAIEATRTLRVLITSSNKNNSLEKKYREPLKKAMLEID